MPLDPQIAAALALRRAAGLRPLSELSPEEAREQLARIVRQRPTVLPFDACTIDDGAVGQVPTRRYRPPGKRNGCIVYYHGGGWVLGSLDDSDQLCLALAAATTCTVYSVDYRLAPEHPFPAAAEDAYAALVAIAAREPAEKIVLVGDSAGANLATVAALRARDEGGPALALQVLVYPVTDHDFERPSYLRNGDLGYVLSTADMRWFWSHYLPDAARRSDPIASPLHAELQGLPPALVVVAEYDPLHDEGVAYAERLRTAGVPVELQEYRGAVHGFIGMLGSADAADELLSAVSVAVRAAVAPD